MVPSLFLAELGWIRLGSLAILNVSETMVLYVGVTWRFRIGWGGDFALCIKLLRQCSMINAQCSGAIIYFSSRPISGGGGYPHILIIAACP